MATSDQQGNPRLNLYDLDLAALEALMAQYGQPAYRASQVWEWLYVQLAASLDEMTNIPKALREQLSSVATIEALERVDTLESPDGETRKDLLRLDDGETIETVLMHYEQRRTACISTQVGCAAGCTFCATGQMGLRRNLTAGEIVAQALHFARLLRAQDERLSNVVLMGMGEPLLNYEASLAAIRRLTDSKGLAIGQRHVTLSTIGIAPAIARLSGERLQITLAVSLHAATDQLRDSLVPMNRRYGLDAIFEACFHYIERTGRRVSFEWVLIEGVNDGLEQAQALAVRLKGMLAHVNLIPLNPIHGYPGRPPSENRITAFTNILDRHHVAYTLRVRRGIDIQAGCGQLRQRQAR